MANSSLGRSERAELDRRLLTILAADVAEYSRLIAEDERKTLDHLENLHSIIEEEIRNHNGRIANTAGDSVVAAFQSAVDAVDAAITIQRRHSSYNEPIDQAKRLMYRIGINIGDVSEKRNGDILGHGVNIAARLEAIAVPGGICVSKNVVEQVEGKIETDFHLIGEHYVKNIDKPIKAYSTTGEFAHRYRGLVRTRDKFFKSTAWQLSLFFLVCAVSALLILDYFQIFETRPPRNDLDVILDQNLPPEELLSQFDLVTYGEFESSRYYIIRTWGGTIDQIEELASQLNGHLVAINSAAENDFVFELSMSEEGHWIETDSGFNGPMIGLVQEPGSQEPDGGWNWLNGDPLDYINWKPGGPDNYNGNQSLANLKNNRGTHPVPFWNDMKGVAFSSIIEVPQ